jgi:hypothetical protein
MGPWMKKLTLDVESLTVESFDTSWEARMARGTVRGRESVTGPEDPQSIVASCDCPPGTAASACGATCDWSCGGGCSVATCGQNTCAQTCPNTCFICGPQDPG